MIPGAELNGMARAVRELADLQGIKRVTPKMVAHMLAGDGVTKNISKTVCTLVAKLANEMKK